MSSTFRRFGLAAFVVLSLTAAGIVDRLAPATPRLPIPDRPAETGGVWACPFLKAVGGPGWLHLANFSDEPSHIRVTYVPDRKKPVTQVFEIGPGRAGTVGAPKALRSAAAGAIVEYAGGDLVVSRTAFLTANGGTGGAAAACGRPGAQVLVAAQGSTLTVDTQLVLMNPGTSDALVDVSLVFDGQELEPESLRGKVVPARSRLVIREGDFAFDEAAVVGVVRVRSGRIVADALLASPGLIELVPLVGAAGETVAIGHTGSSLTFSAVTVGDVDAVTEGRTLSADGQGVFEPLAAGLPPDSPRVTPLPPNSFPPGAVAVVADSSTSPVVLGARWQITGRGGVQEQAASVAVPPAMRASAVIGPPANDLRLLVANSAQRGTTISVSVVTEDGPAAPSSLQRINLAAGEAAELRLGRLDGAGSVGVLVTSTEEPIVAVIQGIAVQPSFGVYAVTANPDVPTRPVAVDPDPRAGVT